MTLQEAHRGGDRARLTALILAAAAARVCAAVSIPLLASEAYYWLWGQYPACGYVDHPPMVGWMSAIFFGWVRGSALAARSAPIILGALTTLVVYALARELFPQTRTAWRAALMFSLVPVFAMGSVLIQPDNSLAFFCALTWFCFWRAMEADLGRGKYPLPLWIAAGAAAGLALLSKFHAWILLPPLYLFLAASPEHRKLLRKPGPWLALALSLAVLSPNLFWNARHHWLTYAFQSRRSGLRKSEFNPAYVLTYVLGPILTLSPMIYAAMLASVWRTIKEWKKDAAGLYLLFAGLPLPLFLGILSTRVSIALHWPTTAYIPLVVLAAARIERGEILAARGRKALWITAAALTGALYLLPLAARAIPPNWKSPYRKEEINAKRLKAEMIRWDEVGAKVRALREEMNAAAPAVIMTADSHLASLLAFHSGLPRECFTISKVAHYSHNFGLWLDQRGGLRGSDAVFVFTHPQRKESPAQEAKSQAELIEKLQLCFDRVERATPVVCYADGTVGPPEGSDKTRPRLKAFLLYRCYGFRGPNFEEK
ncbi:glycosyltransferase family 39 protein [Candidatus Sumerlaeota bacterium]|nr:glycosyltransferase family 39 protein [Candidatus Sumerlaeota bacterium]MBI3737121.1 glycosyltransferase family 39 protein [Candidatus Sumerlaeota bacterium]